jgi:hypothetical protein
VRDRERASSSATIVNKVSLSALVDHLYHCKNFLQITPNTAEKQEKIQLDKDKEQAKKENKPVEDFTAKRKALAAKGPAPKKMRQSQLHVGGGPLSAVAVTEFVIRVIANAMQQE